MHLFMSTYLKKQLFRKRFPQAPHMHPVSVCLVLFFQQISTDFSKPECVSSVSLNAMMTGLKLKPIHCITNLETAAIY